VTGDEFTSATPGAPASSVRFEGKRPAPSRADLQPPLPAPAGARYGSGGGRGAGRGDGGRGEGAEKRG
jgi:hypothetical protein